MTIVQVIVIVVSLLLIFGWSEYTREDELTKARNIVRKLNKIRRMFKSMDTTFSINKYNATSILKKLRTIRSMLIELENDINPLVTDSTLIDVLITNRLVICDELITSLVRTIRIQKYIHKMDNSDYVKLLRQYTLDILSNNIVEGLDILISTNKVMYIIYDFTSNHK